MLLIIGVRDEVTERPPSVEFDAFDALARGDAYAVLDERQLRSPALIPLCVDDAGEAEDHALGLGAITTNCETEAVLEQQSHPFHTFRRENRSGRAPLGHRFGIYRRSAPPLVVIVSPLTQLAWSDARNAIAAATSSGSPSRPIG